MAINHDEHLPEPGAHEFGVGQGNLGGNPHDTSTSQDNLRFNAPPFDTVTAMREGLMRDGLHPSQRGTHPYTGHPARNFGVPPGGAFLRTQSFSQQGFGPAPFTTIDMNEYMAEVSIVEETFASYLCEFPPVRITVGVGEGEPRPKEIEEAMPMVIAMVRQLREFVIAQLTEHLGSRRNGHDPFFAHHHIPRLLPIPEHDAVEKGLETIPFGDYFQRLVTCFPNFSTPVFMHLIVAFGESLKVGTSTVMGAPREHFLILPDAQQVVTDTAERLAHQEQVRQRR